MRSRLTFVVIDVVVVVVIVVGLRFDSIGAVYLTWLTDNVPWQTCSQGGGGSTDLSAGKIKVV